MKYPSLLAIGIAVSLICGCGKKPAQETVPSAPETKAKISIDSADSVAPPPPPSAAAAPAPDAAPAETPAPDSATEGRDGFLKRIYSADANVAMAAMNQFIAGRNMTATTELKSFEQLVTEGGWPRAPKPPNGMRYTLDPKTRLVVLTP